MKLTTALAAPLRAAAFALLLSAGLSTQHSAQAQATPNTPERMTYQGFLVDANGVALGNSAPKNYDVVFKIYTDPSAGVLKWAEQQTVTVDKGYFSVLLGEGASTGDPKPELSTVFRGADASDRYVGITVKGIGAGGANVDILPRLRLLSAPYAYLAQQATKLVKDNGNDLLASSGSQLTLSGGLQVSGNNVFELGAGLTKEGSAGKFGYSIFTANTLDIVGAGTTGNNRAVKIWAEGGLTVTGPVTATSFTGSGAGLTGVARPDGSGNLRLGETTAAVGAASWGSALVLSGSNPILAGYNGDNSDPLWLARYNTVANSSELRAVIGDDPGSTGDRFVIGTMQGSGNFSQGATWAPQATIDARGFMGLNGREPDYPLSFPNTLGDKINLWGNAGAAHYGFGIQSGTLQIHSDSSGAGIAFGYGSSGSFNETGRINYDALFVRHPSHPQVQLLRPDGRYAQFYRDGATLYLGLNLSNHDNNHRQATYNGDANWDFSSDRKLKKQIVDAEPVLDRALKVQVRTFRWKDSDDSMPKMIGVIAQELEPLFPDMVTTNQDRQTGESHLAVGYGDFAVIAIKAIQEFKAQHDAEVKDLKAQVADLRTQMKDVLQAAAELRGQVDKSKVTAAVAK